MIAQSLSGIPVQAQLLAELTQKVKNLSEQGKRVGLGTILVGDDPASQYYVKSLKHSLGKSIGITPIHAELPHNASTDQVLETVAQFNENPQVDAYIVQLPLPRQIDTEKVLEHIDPRKDADGLHPTNLGKLLLDVSAPLPCTPHGIVHLLHYYDIPLAGANITIIGRGITVGKPLSVLLARKSENATVTLTHTGTRDIADSTRSADIVISAIGVPGYVRADMISSDAVVIDVGVSRVNGKLTGDVAADVWEKAHAVSPNPKGVGPLTTGFLMSNVVDSAEKTHTTSAWGNA